MANTTFSGPVISTNGFQGSTTGNVTGNVTGFANKIDTAGNGSGWKVEASGTDLHFIYNGTTVASLESNGLVRFANDIVAFDTSP